MSRAPSAACALVLAWLAAAPASAEPSSADQAAGTQPEAPNTVARDTFAFQGSSETYLQLFQSALTPGPTGALVSTTTSAPATQYLSARAVAVDSPWHPDALTVEANTWGSLVIGDAYGEQHLDADITSLNVTYRAYGAFVKAGRQTFAGGAARFARFDGSTIGYQSDVGVGVEVYGGWTVLPRWDAQPGYHHLGSAADSLLKNPELSNNVDRSGYWLAGARLHYAYKDWGHAGLSFHEQQEASALGRRNAGADFSVSPLEELQLAGTAVWDVDAKNVADGRLWLTYSPVPHLSFNVEGLYSSPALFLSKQSVLSVFGGEQFQEVGGSVHHEPFSWLDFDLDGFVQIDDVNRPGSRAGVALRLRPSADAKLLLIFNGRRVKSHSNGYWLLRHAWRYRVAVPWTLTTDLYGYFYDEAIAGYNTSLVANTNVEWQFSAPGRVLAGTSVSSTPYAAADVQALVRAVFDWHDIPGGLR